MTDFIFITLPNMFFRISQYLRDFIVFVFDELEFSIGSINLSFSPFEIFFGAGISVIGVWLVLKFFIPGS